MIDRTHDLPIVRQCRILELARATADYQPSPVSPDEFTRMRRIAALHLAYPCAGARLLSRVLTREADRVGRRHVATLMKWMGLHALYRKPDTSQRHPAHTVYPSRLRQLEIPRPNHVWAADSPYIPMQRGVLSLFAVMDGSSRRVLAWRLSNTLTTDFCRDAVQAAITRSGIPAIFNTDQGGQFTRSEFTGLLKQHGMAISRDGTGCWRDTVFVERRWKSVKYEAVYLHAYDSGSEAQSGLETYGTFSNQQRPHSALDDKTPDEVYFDNLPTLRQAVEAEHCRTTLKKWDILSNQVRPPLFCREVGEGASGRVR